MRAQADGPCGLVGLWRLDLVLLASFVCFAVIGRASRKGRGRTTCVWHVVAERGV